MRGAALLVLLVVTAGLVAAAPANARDDLALDHPARAVALSATGEHVLVGVADQGTRVDNNPNQDTWLLYTVLSNGFNLAQEGGVDPADCNDFLSSDDCNTPAVAVAISSDGSRLAAGGQVNGDEATVAFGTAAQGLGDPVEVAGVLLGLASSSDGARVMALLDDPALNQPGRVVAWTVGGASATQAWSELLPGNPTAFDVRGDGGWTIVAAGNNIVRITSAGTDHTDTANNAVNAVAIADDAAATAVAGLESGHFRIYSSGTTGGNRELNIPGTGAITAVAIAPDASEVAIGRTGGRLTIHALGADPVLLGDSLFNADIGSAIDALEYSADGRVLLVRQDARLQMRATVPDVPVLWESTLPADPAGVAMDATGDLVAAVHGSSLRLYEANHAFTLTAPSPGDLMPGQDYALVVTVRNDGNRHEDVHLSASGPSSLTISVAPESATVLPGAQHSFQLNVQVPAGHPPQEVDINLTADAGNGGTRVRTIATQVPALESWSLETGIEPTSLPVQPGQSVDFQMSLRNDGNVAGVPPVSVTTVGAGWLAEVVGGTSSMAPGDERTLTVRMTAPAGAADGSQGKARVSLPGEPFVELVATVGASFGVELDVPANVAIEPGGSQTITATLRNTGNVLDRYQITLGTLPAGWSARLATGQGAATDDVAAGATREIQITVEAPAGEVLPTGLTVQATSLADANAAASETVTLEPRSQETDDPDNPGPVPAWLVLAVLAGAVVAWRRR